MYNIICSYLIHLTVNATQFQTSNHKKTHHSVMCLHCTKNPHPRSLLSTQSFSHRSDNVTPSSSSHLVAVRNDIRHGTMRNGAVRPWGRSPQRHTTVQLTQSATTYDNYTSHSLRSLARMPQIRQVLHPSSYGNDVPRKRFYTG